MRTRFVVVTGLSGSGKSSVAKVLEDLGYYTIDNLPLPLLATLLEDPLRMIPERPFIAVVTDVRAPRFHEELPRLLEGVDRDRLKPILLFLEAAEETLVRRFSESRRPHPLAGDRPVIEGIRQEHEILAELRAEADLVLDTTDWTVHDLRSHVYREFAESPGEEPGMVVTLTSFGFKHGIPYGTDLLFDVRFLDNPHFVPGLRELTGRDRPVLDYLEAREDFHELRDRLADLLLFLLPRFRANNRSYVSIAIGCTGGHHRSVAIAEALVGRLGEEGWPAKVVHRDVGR